MSYFEPLLLGLVQGITEFLPISSSGHLILTRAIFGFETENSLAFDAVIHLATLVAIFIALWPEVKAVFFGALKKPGYESWSSVAWMILVATLPVALVGFFFGDQIETILRQVPFVVASLIFWGIILWLVDRYAVKRIYAAQNTGWKRTLFVGVAQTLALIPGTSRSGISITAARLAGLDRRAAARLAFLLGIPALAGAGLVKFVDLMQSPGGIEWAYVLTGFVAALVSGILAIRFLLKFLEKRGFFVFAVYRVILAVIVWVLFV